MLQSVSCGRCAQSIHVSDKLCDVESCELSELFIVFNFPPSSFVEDVNGCSSNDVITKYNKYNQRLCLY